MASATPAGCDPRAASRRAESLGKAKVSPKTRHRGGFLSCPLRLRLPFKRFLNGHRPAAALGSCPSRGPLIEDTAEPAGWLPMARGLVDLATKFNFLLVPKLFQLFLGVPILWLHFLRASPRHSFSFPTITPFCPEALASTFFSTGKRFVMVAKFD